MRKVYARYELSSLIHEGVNYHGKKDLTNSSMVQKSKPVGTKKIWERLKTQKIGAMIVPPSDVSRNVQFPKTLK